MNHDRAGRPLKDTQIKYSTQRFLRVLFLKDGVRQKLQISPSNLTNWWRRGYVPLDKVGEISHILKISPYLLNYSGMSILMNKKLSWEGLLSKARLSSKDFNYIQKGISPKS